MNRTLLMPLACAAALSAGATDATYTQYLTGVQSVTPAGVPTASGGDWGDMTGIDLENDGGAVVFDTGDSGEMRLDVTAAPADTLTLVHLNDTCDHLCGLMQGVAGAGYAVAMCDDEKSGGMLL